MSREKKLFTLKGLGIMNPCRSDMEMYSGTVQKCAPCLNFFLGQYIGLGSQNGGTLTFNPSWSCAKPPLALQITRTFTWN